MPKQKTYTPKELVRLCEKNELTFDHAFKFIINLPYQSTSIETFESLDAAIDDFYADMSKQNVMELLDNDLPETLPANTTIREWLFEQYNSYYVVPENDENIEVMLISE